MNALIRLLTKAGLLWDDLDYHLIRASLVVIYAFFGYSKWCPTSNRRSCHSSATAR
jgi:uncharacterized membrane protein YkgB